VSNSYAIHLHFPNGSEHKIVAGAGETVLNAALRHGIELPNTCCQGWCVTCAARLEGGRVHHPRALRYYQADYEAGFILPCTAEPLSEVEITTHQKAAFVAHREAHRLPAPRG